MGIGSTLNKLLYGVSFRTAINTKNRYHRNRMETSNRALAKAMTEGWDLRSRAEEYVESVLPYWQQFDRQPKQFWFELAGSREQKMDPRFIPSDLYYLELLPYMNNLPFRWALEDKNYLELRFPDVKQAKAVCRKIAGEYYDGKMDLIQEEDAVSLCNKSGGELFIKPSIYSGFGNGVRRFDPSQCGDAQIRGHFAQTGQNFIVQEKIVQHEILEAVSPGNVCTIRVLSLFLQGRVHIPQVYLRLGASSSSHVVVGEEYNAEIFIDGHIHAKACHDEGYWVNAHEVGLYDEDFVIPGIGKILETVRRIHPRVGHFKWIGWDFTLDQDGYPLLIELNSTPGDHAQRVSGRPLFGEMTDWLLEDYFKNRSMDDFQIRGCWTGSEDIRKYRE